MAEKKTFTTQPGGQATGPGTPPKEPKWRNRFKWLWARRWGKAVIGITVVLILIVGFTPADEDTAPERAATPAQQPTKSPGTAVANLACADGLCAGSLKVESPDASARVRKAGEGIQWALAENSDADRAALIVAGPGAATWVQCTRAQSKAAGADAAAIQDECKVQRRSASVGLDADVAARGSQFDRPSEREAPELEKRLTAIDGLVDDPARLMDWAVDQCGAIQGGAGEAALIRATRLRFAPGASKELTDEQAKRVIAAVRDTFCDTGKS